MKCAAFFDQVEAVDAGDGAVGKKLTENAEGAVVVAGLAEGGYEEAVVYDEEIHVGSGQDGESPTGDLAGFGEMDLHKFERFAIRGAEIAQAVEVFFEDGMVR